MDYILTGVEKATMSADRSQFDIQFRTHAGPLTVQVSASNLGALISMLEGLEHQASVLNPSKGLQPGEPAQFRMQIVESHQIGHCDANGVPSVMLGFKSGQVFRWYALDAPKAKAVHQALADEIPKMGSIGTIRN